MAAKMDKLQRYYRKYYQTTKRQMQKDPSAKALWDFFRTGKDLTVTQLSRTETKKFDTHWIDTLNDGLEAIENIINDPKRFIKSERYITPIELAKKITSESVIHLSSHSQYVKEIDDKGQVIPSKILTVQAEDDYAIYENRFVMTLIEKLLIFIEKRYDYIKKHADTKDSDVLVVQNTVTIDDIIYEYETKIKIKAPSADEGNRDINRALLTRIEYIRSKIVYFAQSEFMTLLKEAKPVTSPIMQTNTIRKHPDYRKCLTLWRFLDTYNQFGIKINVKETSATFDETYLDQIFTMMMIDSLVLRTNKTAQIKANLEKSKVRTVVPKVKKRIADIDFDDSRFQYVEHVGRGNKGLTEKQKEAEKERLRREKAKERERIRKEKALQRLLEKKARRKARLEERKRLARLKRLEELQKKKEIERQRREEELARKREQALLDEEYAKVVAARKKVRELARLAKAKEKAKKAKAEALQKAKEKRERERLKEKAKQKAAKARERQKLRKQKAKEKAQARRQAKTAKVS